MLLLQLLIDIFISIVLMKYGAEGVWIFKKASWEYRGFSEGSFIYVFV